MTEEASSPAEGDSREALELVHHHPGRLRVRSDALRAGADGEAHAAIGERVRSAMAALPGITKVTHNARTGSLLVEYEPGLVEPDAIAARIAEAAGLASPFEARRDFGKRTTPAEVLVEATRELNAIVFELTGWRADLRSLVPASIAALGVYSFVVRKEDRLPRWDNLAYWSYSIFSQLHQREIQRHESIPHDAKKKPPHGKDEP